MARSSAARKEVENSPSLEDSLDSRPTKRRRTEKTYGDERTDIPLVEDLTQEADGTSDRAERRQSEEIGPRASKPPTSTKKAVQPPDGARRSARRVSRRLQAAAAEGDVEAVTVSEAADESGNKSTAGKDATEGLVDSAYASKEDSLIEVDVPSNDAVDGTSMARTRPTVPSLESTNSLEIPETPGQGSDAAKTPRSKRASTRRIYSQQKGSGSAKKTHKTIEADADGDELIEAAEAPQGRSSARATRNGRSGSQTTGARASAQVDTVVISESEDELQSVGTTPIRVLSSRARRATRYSVEPQSSREPTPLGATPSKSRAAAVGSPQPKGILTPSKGKRNARPKSVVFDPDEKQIREQLGFKDIDESAKKRTRGARASVATYNEDEEEIEVEEAVPQIPQEDDPLLDFDQPVDILQSLQRTSRLPTLRATEDTPALREIKTQVLSQLTSAKPCPPASHLATQQSTLTNLLRSTIVSGESNSLLLLGPRGSGKTLLLEHVLKQLDQEHASLFHTVRLNGFFQTDDRLALREIWRQLGRETQENPEGEEPASAAAGLSYADTLASLLSLLSHPDEMDVDQADADVHMTNGVDDDEPVRAAKSTIIILDEFDLFTLHPRQTLLYNLFDIAQSRKAPIAVIGCSTRMDVVESLEKRVKSRFSHRWLHVPPVRTLSEMLQVVEAATTVASSDFSDKLSGESAETTSWNEYIKKSFLSSPMISQVISQTFHSTKSVPEVLAALYAPIATLSIPSTPSAASARKSIPIDPALTPQPPAPQIIHPPIPIASTDQHHTILSLALHLPTLHLALLAALSSPSYPSPLPSFSTTFTHYQFLLSRTKLLASSGRASLARTTGPAAGIRQWSRGVCQSAWEEMVSEWGVLALQSGGGGGVRVAVDEWAGVRVELDEEDVLWVLKQRAEGGGEASGEVRVFAGWVRGDVV